MVNLIIVVLAVLGLISGAAGFAQSQALKRRFNQALGGTEAGSLESTLASHLDRVEQVDQRLSRLTEDYEKLSVAASLASQKISIVRYNPFGDTGGDQSFSLAVLDAHDSGYVLSSIHGRQGTRVYVKPIDLGKSKYTLAAEEKQAFTQAAKRVPKDIN